MGPSEKSEHEETCEASSETSPYVDDVRFAVEVIHAEYALKDFLVRSETKDLDDLFPLYRQRGDVPRNMYQARRKLI